MARWMGHLFLRGSIFYFSGPIRVSKKETKFLPEPPLIQRNNKINIRHNVLTLYLIVLRCFKPWKRKKEDVC